MAKNKKYTPPKDTTPNDESMKEIIEELKAQEHRFRESSENFTQERRAVIISAIHDVFENPQKYSIDVIRDLYQLSKNANMGNRINGAQAGSWAGTKIGVAITAKTGGLAAKLGLAFPFIGAAAGFIFGPQAVKRLEQILEKRETDQTKDPAQNPDADDMMHIPSPPDKRHHQGHVIIHLDD